MPMPDVNLESYSNKSYHNEELKSLTHFYFDKVKERAKPKTSISRPVCILFPKLENPALTLHQNSVYELLYKIPGVSQVANARLTRLINLVATTSNGHYTNDTAFTFREATRGSIGSNIPAKSLELKHTIKLIRKLMLKLKKLKMKSILQF